MLTSLANLIQSTADALFMPWVVGILLASGLFLTIRTGAVQVRRFTPTCETCSNWSVDVGASHSPSSGPPTAT